MPGNFRENALHALDVRNAEILEIRAHRCFPCLTGREAEKRDCAVARLIANGFGGVCITRLAPSSKTEHQS